MRRALLCIAFLLLFPVNLFAGFHGGGASAIVVTGNGQLDVTNDMSGDIQVFLNAFKGGSNGWVCEAGGNATPDQIQTNGMPTSTASCLSTGGILHTASIPLDTQQASACGSGRCNWAWIWSGNCGMSISNVSVTTESGSPGSSSSFGTSPWIFQVPAGTTALNANILDTDGTCGAPVIVMVGTCTSLHSGCGDYDAYNAGGIFKALYYQPILDAKFSKFRAIGWETSSSINTNISSVTYNKPYNYPYWYAPEQRPSIWIPSSEMTYSNVSNEVYTGTCTGICTVETGSNGPQDRDTVFVQWNQTATSGSDTYFSLNGTTPIELADTSCTPGASTKPVSGQTAILIYEKQLNVWCEYGNTAGLFNGVPVQVILQFCNLIKSHCVIAEPYLELDPDNGWVTWEANLAKSTLLAGLNDILENPDETWNFESYPQGNYANAKSNNNWGSFEFTQEQCMWQSTAAQDLQRVYGTAPGHGWEIETGVQTAGNPPAPTTYLNCSAWVAANVPTPAQSGVQILPLYEFSPAVMVTSYMFPGETSLAQEIIDAYNYVNGNASTASTIANNYEATLTSDTNTPNNNGTLFFVNAIWTAYQTYIATDNTNFSGTVNYNGSTWTSNISLTQYEGGQGLSADAGCSGSQLSSSCFSSISSYGAPAISNITAASSAVITLSSTDLEGDDFTAVNGMPITIFGSETAGFNQSCNVTGVAANVLTTNCNTVGLTYSDFTITTTAKPGKGSKTVTVSSCTNVNAGLSVWDETQTDLNGVVVSCSGGTLTIEQAFKHTGATTTDTLLIGGGMMQYGADTSGDGFSSATITGATAAKPCSFTLSSPMNVFPPSNVTTSGVTPSGYNFTTGSPPGVNTYSIDSTGKNVTLAADCTGAGSYVSGGTMSVSLAQAVNGLRFASRYAAQAQTVWSTAINEFTAAGGTGMALYFYGCCGYTNSVFPNSNSAWGAFWPTYTFTPSPMWNAYVAENGGTYP